ncbi:MAG: ATP synthase F1 subunit gamma [Bacteroidales bacterium]|jgi:F-type H+-transporting ATPase subunit gamma|nr:ATP synthase F1 subunit gamma [Bacteroidales bacterium]MDD3152432.1 ATP synthase F1 subunit gamma [Bacteroidales bacterium]MDD3913846.1 ATP synthase F1 subunit gamma [Bacteroidales bacterium]MDD4634517.1 ATP synthase F1 subunit gamma [Bacteroidales bacterium]
MASLKEIKSRIASVNSTKQITSAMKMISSAKLRKAQDTVSYFYPYQQKLHEILYNYMEYERRNNCKYKIIYSERREIKKVAIVVISSNSSLCGAFNSNIFRLLEKTIESYTNLSEEDFIIIPIGKMATKFVKRYPDIYQYNLDAFVDKPIYNDIAGFADNLAQLFLEDKVDKIEFIYQHFKNNSVQVLTKEQFLPFQPETVITNAVENEDENDEHNFEYEVNYIVEPDRQQLLYMLIPTVIRQTVYGKIIDSIAAEHSARTIAMQVATDNATDLLQSLKIQYNKSRQQAITNELLDIMGGSIDG